MEEVRSSILLSSTPTNADRGPVSDWALAGFVAGEGSFGITTKQPPFADGDPRLRFTFELTAAERDRPLLEQLGERLGAGSIRVERPKASHLLPITRLRVASIRTHRASVIPWMHRHLLAGRKRRQFDLWREAMDSYEAYHPSKWGKGPSTCRVPGCDRPVRGRGLCRSHYHRETGH